MKHYVLWFFLLIQGCINYGVDDIDINRNGIDSKISQLRYIKELPYIPELSGDKIYWEILKEKDVAIPALIERIDDTSATEATIPNVPGDSLVGDVAIFLLQDLVKGIPVLQCIDGNIEYGFMDYWKYVRGNVGARATLKKRLSMWYEKNKDSLKWVEDTKTYRAIPNWYYDNKRHPAGGYFVTDVQYCE